MIDFGRIFHIVIPAKACPQPDWRRESRTRANTPGFRVPPYAQPGMTGGLCVFEFRFVLLNTLFALLP